MTPSKWLVAPADMGPSCPGLVDMVDRFERAEEMRRSIKAWRAAHPDYVAAPTYAPDAPKVDLDLTRCLP